MRITIDNRTYYKPINLSFEPRKIHKKLFKIFPNVCGWIFVFIMCYILAVMALECY